MKCALEAGAYKPSKFAPEKKHAMMEFWIHIAPLGTFVATLAWFLICLPTMFGAWYQSWKARQEAKQAREAALHSKNCLEFVSGDGSCINLVPLDSLHTLPKPGDVVLLPGRGVGDREFLPGAYLVQAIEHIYSQFDAKGSRPQEARLTKAVAQVTSLNPTLTV
ncbi:MAG: hypothetical protein ACLPY1_01100 [Terracidiphilus sp.]